MFGVVFYPVSPKQPRILSFFIPHTHTAGKPDTDIYARVHTTLARRGGSKNLVLFIYLGDLGFLFIDERDGTEQMGNRTPSITSPALSWYPPPYPTTPDSVFGRLSARFPSLSLPRLSCTLAVKFVLARPVRIYDVSLKNSVSVFPVVCKRKVCIVAWGGGWRGSHRSGNPLTSFL